MLATEQGQGSLVNRVKVAGLHLLRRAGFCPAALLLLLQPFRSLYRLYPRPVREFLSSWSADMIRLYVRSLGTRAYIDQPCTVTEPASYAPRVEAGDAFRLSQEHIRSFYANGFLGPFTLCPPEEMIQVREEVLRELERPSAVYGFKTGRDRHLDCESVYRLVQRPALTERLAQILGPDLLLWRSQVFVKPPGAPAVSWHQASTYLMEGIFRPALFPPKAWFRMGWFRVTLFAGSGASSSGISPLLPRVSGDELRGRECYPALKHATLRCRSGRARPEHGPTSE